jgi:hypothetical protein
MRLAVSKFFLSLLSASILIYAPSNAATGAVTSGPVGYTSNIFCGTGALAIDGAGHLAPKISYPKPD